MTISASRNHVSGLTIWRSVKALCANWGRLLELGLEPYDGLSPPLMDLIAAHTAKAA